MKNNNLNRFNYSFFHSVSEIAPLRNMHGKNHEAFSSYPTENLFIHVFNVYVLNNWLTVYLYFPNRKLSLTSITVKDRKNMHGSVSVYLSYSYTATIRIIVVKHTRHY